MRCFVLILVSGFCLSVFGQYKISEYEIALEAHTKDDMGELLHEAAKHFEDKLNTFRKKNRANELKHLNQAWLMSLNHCLWIRENKNLTHSERKNTKYYTGSSLSQRLTFVQSGAQFGGLGENIAFIELADDALMNTVLLAEKLAEDFFQLWKKSPTHRKNMIEKSFSHHGIVFLKSGMRVYGVHVFYATP